MFAQISTNKKSLFEHLMSHSLRLYVNQHESLFEYLILHVLWFYVNQMPHILWLYVNQHGSLFEYLMLYILWLYVNQHESLFEYLILYMFYSFTSTNEKPHYNVMSVKLFVQPCIMTKHICSGNLSQQTVSCTPLCASWLGDAFSQARG